MGGESRKGARKKGIGLFFGSRSQIALGLGNKIKGGSSLDEESVVGLTVSRRHDRPDRVWTWRVLWALL